MSALPLEGIRVVDLAVVWAGPTVGRVLADLGADVIKVERLTAIDGTRFLYVADWDHEGDFWNRGLYLQKAQAGKRAITLDLSRESGKQLLARLIGRSDVVVENFTPHVMQSLGFDYESCKQLKPDIIFCSMSGYGGTGPYGDFRAIGMGLEPAAGVPHITGYPGGPPYKNGNTFADPLGGLLGAYGVLAALHHRRRTGEGQYIRMSLQEASIQIVGEALMEYQLTGRLPELRANRSASAAPQGVYRCRGADDWLYLSAGSDEEWEALCNATGHTEWARDERFADALARHRNHDALDGLIGEWCAGQDKTAAMDLLQRAGVMAAAVLNPREALLNEQLAAREFFTPVEIPGVEGPRPVWPYVPAKFSRFDAKPRGPAPAVGQHNREVFHDLLGVSDEELAQLEEEGVIGTEPVLPLPPDQFGETLAQPLEQYREQGAVLAIEGDYRDRVREATQRDAPGDAPGRS
ncbi:MAG: CoA transferase [Chloroflexi bacterium]|nr:CoA transferase [Chloroflexota bacterium]